MKKFKIFFGGEDFHSHGTVIASGRGEKKRLVENIKSKGLIVKSIMRIRKPDLPQIFSQQELSY